MAKHGVAARARQCEDHPEREPALELSPIAHLDRVPAIGTHVVWGHYCHAPARHEQQGGIVGAAGREDVEGHVSASEGTLASERQGETVGDGRARRDAGRLRQDGEPHEDQAPHYPETHEGLEGAGQDGGAHAHAVLRRGREGVHQRPAQLLGGLEALGGVLGERAIDEARERGRDLAPVLWIGTGVAVACFMRMDWAESPSNGGTPASI